MDQFPDQHITSPFNDIEEFIIDDLKKIPVGKYPYFALVEKDTLKFLNLEKETLSLYHSEEAEGIVREDYYGNFIVYVWASNVEEANKNAIDKLNKYLEDNNISTSL